MISPKPTTMFDMEVNKLSKGIQASYVMRRRVAWGMTTQLHNRLYWPDDIELSL